MKIAVHGALLTVPLVCMINDRSANEDFSCVSSWGWLRCFLWKKWGNQRKHLKLTGLDMILWEKEIATSKTKGKLFDRFSMRVAESE